MKTFNLIKTRDGHRSGNAVTRFVGDDINDQEMLKEVKSWLRDTIEAHDDSLTYEELDEIVSDFDGSLRYDVYTYSLEEEDQEEDEEEDEE